MGKLVIHGWKAATVGAWCCRVALLLSCSVFPGIAWGCTDADYRAAAGQFAKGDYPVGEHILASCGDDPTAQYLLGMLPRFGVFDSVKIAQHRSALSRASAAGLPAAQSLEGFRLLDTGEDRAHAAALISSAYESGDAWATWLGFLYLSAPGEALSEAANHRLEVLAQSGFPLSYGVLALQARLRAISRLQEHDVETALRETEAASALAVEGSVRGDPLAVSVLIRVNKDFKEDTAGLEALHWILTNSDAAQTDNARVDTLSMARSEWNRLLAFSELRQQPEPLEVSMRICAGERLKQHQRLCEMRAVIDHFVCMEPFAAFYDANEWMRSAAYSECRVMRLGKSPSIISY